MFVIKSKNCKGRVIIIKKWVIFIKGRVIIIKKWVILIKGRVIINQEVGHIYQGASHY